MRRYETIFISDPDLSETERGQVFEKTKNLISDYNGILVVFDEWGIKKLAYDIKKKNRGYYVLINYCGDGNLVDEMERSFRIDDRVLKFMTIVLDKEVDPEAIQLELSKAEEAAAAEQAKAEAAAEQTKVEAAAEQTKVEAAEVADTVDSSEIEPDEEEGEKEKTPTQTIEEE
ncbi:MAG: 30S ribosomal protein S6 [Deltaproteobacteria bacterium]|nr:30S ribosomal protein S6 [Deltaproteobacteria bacterium]